MANQSIPKKKQICQVEGCGRKYFSSGYCCKHYAQMYYKGYIYGNPNTPKRNEQNRCFFENEVCIIEIYDRLGNVKAHAIIDKEDYKKVSNIRLSTDSNGYVTIPKSTGFSRLHQLIMNGTGIDHKDGNILDNRKSNLRFCDQHHNTMNQKLSAANTSGYKGVYWSNQRKKWVAQGKINGKAKHLGGFTDKKDAARAYNEYATKNFMEFARPNEL